MTLQTLFQIKSRGLCIRCSCVESFFSKQILIASFLSHCLNVLPFLRNKVVRGALTNGHNWIFLLVKLTDDYEGASYKQSNVICLEVYQNLDLQQVSQPDLIAAIVLHWVSLFYSTVIELLAN